jgi:hypothetical protein
VNVSNTGGGTLVLGDVTVPAGFQLTAGPGTASLAAGQTTSFEIAVDSTTIAAYQGGVSLGTNDSDENPFDFTIAAEVIEQPPPPPPEPIIVDDGDAGFSTGGFSAWPDSRGYQDDVHYAPKGSGSRTATWEADVPAGTYGIATTWYVQSGRRPSDATYQIRDCDTSGTVCTTVGAVSVNQQLAPQSFSENGTAWEHLGGPFPISGGKLQVIVSDAVDTGDVVADAVRIEAQSAPTTPEIQVAADGNDVQDGLGTVDFGTVIVGQLATITVTVTNVGGGSLMLDTPSLPTGFSLGSDPGSDELAATSTSVLLARLTTAWN